MEIELYINKELIRKFEAEPPGIFAKTVTSSSTLYEIVPFGKEQSKDKKKLLMKNKKKKWMNLNI